MMVVARRKPVLDIGERGREAGKVGLLREIAEGRALADDPLAAVGLDQPGHDFQQRRFARAVAPDQRQPLAFADAELDVGEQRLPADAERDVLSVRRGGEAGMSGRS